jgi:hypothetical protein
MKKKHNRISRQSAEKIIEFVEELPPENLPEAEEELRSLQLQPHAVGGKLEQIASQAIRERMLREHAARSRTHAQDASDLTNKIN